MWLATKHGFFSIVKKENAWHIRARSTQDLEELKIVAGLSELTVHNTDDADYPARIVTRSGETMQAIFLALGSTIQYPNFKAEIAKSPCQRDKLSFYHEIWSAMRHWQMRYHQRTL